VITTTRNTDLVDQEVPISVATTEAEAAIELEALIINLTTDLEVVMVKIIISASMWLRKIINKAEKILMNMFTRRNLRDSITIRLAEVVVAPIIITITTTSITRMIDNSTERLNMKSILRSPIKVVDFPPLMKLNWLQMRNLLSLMKSRSSTFRISRTTAERVSRF